jgi:hypothetical protein
MRDTMRQNTCLAAAGSRKNENGTFGFGSSGTLLVIERC